MNNAPRVLCIGINAGMADKSQERVNKSTTTKGEKRRTMGVVDYLTRSTVDKCPSWHLHSGDRMEALQSTPSGTYSHVGALHCLRSV